MEYGILRYMGAIDEHTLVVTTVHDCQVCVRHRQGWVVGGWLYMPAGVAGGSET